MAAGGEHRGGPRGGGGDEEVRAEGEDVGAGGLVRGEDVEAGGAEGGGVEDGVVEDEAALVDEGDGALEVEAGGDGDGADLEAGVEAQELEAGGVGAGGQADEEEGADAQDVAAVEAGGGGHAGEGEREAGEGVGDGVALAEARGGAGAGDDGVTVEEDGGVLDEAAVWVGRVRGELEDVDAEGAEGGDVGGVLLAGAGEVRDEVAGPQARGEGVRHGAYEGEVGGAQGHGREIAESRAMGYLRAMTLAARPAPLLAVSLVAASLVAIGGCGGPSGPSGFSASGGSTSGGSTTGGGASTGGTGPTGESASEGSGSASATTGSGTTGGPGSTSGSTEPAGTTEHAGSSGGVGTSSGSSGGADTGSSGEGSSSTGEPVCDAQPIVGATPTPTLVSCPGVKKQSIWCLFLTDVAVMAVGLEDGVACQEKSLQQPLGFSPTASIAVLDATTLLVCDDQGGLDGVLTRVSLADGSVESLPAACQAIAHYKGHLLVLDSLIGGKVRVFAGLDEVLGDAPLLTVVEDPPTTRNIAAGVDALFTAWHSDDHVGRRSLPCGDDLGDLPLENYDDWIGGLSVTDGEVLVALKVLGQEELHTFNVETGAQISAVPLAFDGFVQPRGLTCYTGMP